ncbi:Uncharacterised protein g10191 [Pycnogonum litorale]
MNKLIFVLLLIVAVISRSLGTSCSAKNCDKKSCKAVLNCQHGSVQDTVNCCCQICAKALGEECGGSHDVNGICADRFEM